MRMALKLKFIFNMKKVILPSILLIVSLVGCTSGETVFQRKTYCFGTAVVSKLYDGRNEYLDHIEQILRTYDKVSDYHLRDAQNIYDLNHIEGKSITITSEELYDLLVTSFALKDELQYFDPLIGSLSDKWKESLAKKEVLSEEVIKEELDKIANTTVIINNHQFTKEGKAEIDLGGIAKGYVLDIVHDYLDDKQIKNYLIDAGSSSILLGEKKTKDGFFNISLKDIPSTYMKVKNCVVSTSGTSEQGVLINGVTYSHIINPYTGSAINNYDEVIVISSDGAFGDALSTSMMFNTLDEIKELETKYDVKTLVIKDKKVIYKNEGIELGHL